MYRTAQDYDIVNELQWVGWFDLPDLGIRQYLETNLLISSFTRTYTVREIPSVPICPEG